MTIPRKAPLRRASAKRLAREGPLYSTVSRSRKPVKRKNAKRRATEFARCYGSRERVRFVKSLACLVCTPIFGLLTLDICENAHTENGGKGRKGPYTSIIPLCRSHHRAYDEHRAPLFNQPVVREALRRAAAVVEEKWQLVSQHQEEA